MGQQPNIPLSIEDLPRPTAHPDPPRRWSPRRPGDLHAPGDVPWGGLFGTPGPDTGYVLRLVRDTELAVTDREDRHDAEVAVAALAAARASHFGRAPVVTDVTVAKLILGLDPDLPADVGAALAAERPAWLANASHRPEEIRRLVAGVPVDVLAAPVAEVQRRAAGGERLIRR